MEKIIFYDIKPTRESLFEHLHLSFNDKNAETAEKLFDEASKIAKPKTLLKVVPVKNTEESLSVGDVEITYPYVQKMLAGADIAAVYVSTCGTELELWSHEKQDPSQSRIAETIKLLYLYGLNEPFRQIIRETIFPNDGHLAALNPGSLELWPISEQKTLFAILGGEEYVERKIGVTLSENFWMYPICSTSGLYFLSEIEYENCELCPRITCPNRRAAYKG